MVSKEENNFLRIVYLHYRVATEALRRFFDKLHPNLSDDLHISKNRFILMQLYKPPPGGIRVLFQKQWNILYPPPGSKAVTSADLDLNLMICLLRNLPPQVKPPMAGFDNLPSSTETSNSANFARLKYYKNYLLSQSKNGKLSDEDFFSTWNSLEEAIKGLDNSQATIESLSYVKTKMLDNSIVQLLSTQIQLDKKVSSLQNKIKQIKKNLGEHMMRVSNSKRAFGETSEIPDSLHTQSHSKTESWVERVQKEIEESQSRGQLLSFKLTCVESVDYASEEKKDEIEKDVTLLCKESLQALEKNDDDFDDSLHEVQTDVDSMRSTTEWFYKLPIVCEGFRVDCIIDNRLQSNYKVLQKIIRKKETSINTAKIHWEMDLTNLYLSSSSEFVKLFIFQTMGTISYLNIKDELHKSIEANQINLCRYILMESNTSVLSPLLEEALDTAIRTKCRYTIKAVTSRIVKEVSNLHKNMLDKNTSIWLGIECACKTTRDESYENCLCFSAKPKIILERYQSQFEDIFEDKSFAGFSIKIIDFMESNSKEASVVANKILEKSESQLIEGNISGKIAKELFKKHTNLSIIYPSPMKSKGFNNPGSHKIEKLDCINLVCNVKGVIPVGETHFPLEIEGVQTDVLEGATHLLGTLRIGDVVENANTQTTGTLGGFVKYYGLDTILTCAHVVFGKDNVHTITKQEIHLKNCHKMKDNNSSDASECILIRHQIKNTHHDPSETSIDAALALITTGDLSIINIARDDLNNHCCSGLGLSSPFLNHNAIDPVILRNAKAFCGYSENQISDLKIKKELLLSIPTHFQTGNIKMYNQLCLFGMQFQAGDSGTCVYVDTQSVFSKTGCIGMLIAQSTCGQYVLTPMKEILQAFEL